MVLILGFLGVAAWFIVFALLCVFGIILIVKGRKRAKNGKFPAPAGSPKRKFPPALYIAAGIVLIAISLVILFAVLDCFRGNGYDFLNKSLDLFMKGFLSWLSLFAVIPLAALVWLLLKSIMTLIKLRSIEDVDTYNKKLKLSLLSIFLGGVGIGISIFLLLAIWDVSY